MLTLEEKTDTQQRRKNRDADLSYDEWLQQSQRRKDGLWLLCLVALGLLVAVVVFGIVLVQQMMRVGVVG